jgi:uncharacterized protein
MSPKELPKHLDPIRLCRGAPPEGTTLQGTIPLAQLKNISDEIKSQSDGLLHVVLNFFMDQDGHCAVSGELNATLALTCQRCMQPMTEVLQTSFLVSPVSSDAAAKDLPMQYEPLMLTDGEIDLASWISEELNLALPLVPRHEPPCKGWDSET